MVTTKLYQIIGLTTINSENDMINHRIWEQSIIGMCWTSIPMHTETRTVRTAKGGVQAVLLDETGENEEREVKLQSFAGFSCYMLHLLESGKNMLLFGHVHPCQN